MGAFVGSAVKGGFVRFLSVSSIQKFDVTESGGCPRAWWYRYVAGIKEPETEALKTGQQVAKELEHYLVTGEDVLGPVARAGKHLLPAPGSDLEVELPLGDIVAAVKLREAGRIEESCAAAGLSAGGIPLMGAADVRHRRREYVDEAGVLRPDEAGVEIIDHKTSSRIDNHTTASGRVYQGYAKTASQVLSLTQMVGYGIHAVRKYGKDAEKIRLSHVYYQTKNGNAAAKRSGLISAEDVLRKWSRIDKIAKEIEQVATEKDASVVEVNLNACTSYGRPCAYSGQCPKSTEQLMTSIHAGGAMNPFVVGTKSRSIESSGDAPKASSLFGAVSVQPSDRQAAIAAEKAKLEAEDSWESTKPAAWSIDAVNPPDAPVMTLQKAADPLPPEVIETIEDKELKEKAIAHAAAAPVVEVEKPASKTRKKKSEEPAAAAPAVPAPVAVVSVEPVAAGATIFLDVAVIGGNQPKPLRDYYDPIVKTILEQAGALDLRCAPDGDLSHGKWRGVLTALVKARPVPPGEYFASSYDDVEMTVVHALSARIVRGIR